jgi:integrase
MFAIGLALALRRGEILGLRWTDIDLDAKTLRIEQTIQRVRAKIAGASDFLVADLT